MIYGRLCHIPSGPVSISTVRMALGSNSVEDTIYKLHQLQQEGLVTYSHEVKGRQTVFHITVEPIPETLRHTAPKSAGKDVETRIDLISFFREQEQRVLKKASAGTVVDYKLAKKLLDTTSDDDLKAAVIEYWRIKPEFRNFSNFREFYTRATEMLNRVLEDTRAKETRRRQIAPTAAEKIQDELNKVKRTMFSRMSTATEEELDPYITQILELEKQLEAANQSSQQVS